jgi:hypothetical protein
MATDTSTPAPTSIGVRGYLGDLYATALTWNRYFQWALAFAGVLVCYQQFRIATLEDRLAHQPPVFIRIDDLNRHEVIPNAQVTAPNPREKEIRTDIRAFVVKHYGRLRGAVTRDFHESQYFLAPALQDAAQETIRKDLVELARAGADEVNIEVRDTKIIQLDQLPYRAEVTFDKQYFQAGTRRFSKPPETYNLHVNFELADVSTWTTDYLQFNPLGVWITNLRLEPVYKSAN